VAQQGVPLSNCQFYNMVGRHFEFVVQESARKKTAGVED
jgi:hypothetical protein